MSSLETITIANDVVNSYIAPLLTTSVGGRIPCDTVSQEEPTTGPYLPFGQWLRDRRVEARLESQPKAEIKARRLGLRLINQGKLSHIERGMNGNPDPEFLRQLAKLYTLPYEDVIARWMHVRYAVAIDAVSGTSGHKQEGESAAGTGGAADDTAAIDSRQQLRDLTGEVAYYKSLVRRAYRLAKDTYAALGGEGGPAAAPQSKGRKPA